MNLLNNMFLSRELGFLSRLAVECPFWHNVRLSIAVSNRVFNFYVTTSKRTLDNLWPKRGPEYSTLLRVELVPHVPPWALWTNELQCVCRMIWRVQDTNDDYTIASRYVSWIILLAKWTAVCVQWLLNGYQETNDIRIICTTLKPVKRNPGTTRNDEMKVNK